MTFFYLTTCFNANFLSVLNFPNLPWCFSLKLLPYIFSYVTYIQLKFQLTICCIKITINCTIQSASFETSFSLAVKLFAFLQVWFICFSTYTYLFALKFVAFCSFLSSRYTIKFSYSKSL